MIDTGVLSWFLNRHDVLDILHDTDGSMVAARGGTDGAKFGIRDIMALAAINDFFLKA